MHSQPGQAARLPLAAKVPEVTLVFWVLKLLTTFGGEAISDWLAPHGYVLTGAVEVLIAVAAVSVQFRTRRYVAAAYWFLALAIAIFGTGVSDGLHLVVGIPYAGTSLLWAVVLGVVFWAWQRSEGTLSFHSITTRRRELFYWATVFATFALGTALGDFTAAVLGLGYLGSGVMFAVIFAIPLIARRAFGINPILAFWCAYVITRPLGASFADYIAKPRALSGLGLGAGLPAVVALAAIIVLVAWLSVTRSDIQQPRPASAGGPVRRRGPDLTLPDPALSDAPTLGFPPIPAREQNRGWPDPPRQ